ncbi:MAG: polysaccharide biosynthesis C-terminal domain-containing protein [Taibaiella sp.]|nr:polysaccharide biosynthesis C-terminal domain-containing protein [Taibaiella sp.]
MGVVRKQSIYSSIYIFIGFAIGAANTLLLYTKYLDLDQYGLTGIFRDVSVLFSMMATFGTNNALLKFFPLYQARLGREKNDLPFLVLSVGVIGCIFITAGFLLFKDLIVLKFSEKSPLFAHYFLLSIPLTISLLMMLQMEGFSYMLKRTAAGNLIKDIGFRLVQTIAILLYIFHIIDIDTFFLIFSFMYVPSVIAMVILITYKDGIKLNFRISSLTKKIYRKIISFSLFHFSGVMISVLPFALNGILIAGISDKGLSDVGVYTIAIFMVTMLDIPLRGMRGIGSATYSEAFLHNDIDKVARMQKGASLSLLIVGFALFGLIFPNMENIIYFSKGKDFHPAINIFLIVGTAKLIELSMGMNDTLLTLSKYWKTDFFIATFIVVISIPTNIIFIKWNPLLGAAFGQAIMLLMFCLLRTAAIYKYFKIQPYTSKTPLVMLIGTLATIITVCLPNLENPFADIFLKGLVFIILYAVPVIYFNISKEINDLFLLIKKRILRK